MPITITKQYGRDTKEVELYTVEELNVIFGGNIIRAGESVGLQAELNERLTLAREDLDELNDVVIPEIQQDISDLDDQLNNPTTGLQAQIDTLDGYFDDPSTIPAGYSFFEGIVTNDIWSQSVIAIEGWFDTITANQFFVDKMVANEAVLDVLKANEAWVDTIYSNTIIAADAIIFDAWVDALIANNIFADKITANEISVTDLEAVNTNTGQLIVSGWIRSNNYVGGTSGYTIESDGSAEFSDVYIRGNSVVEGNVLVGGSVDATKLDVDDLQAVSASTGNLTVTGWIRSGNYVAGTSGYTINSDGSAEFSDVTIRGDSVVQGSVIVDNSIIAEKLNVDDLQAVNTNTGNLIVSGSIQSSNPTYVAGVQGFTINSNGFAEFNNIKIRGEFESGTITSGVNVIGNVFVSSAAGQIELNGGSVSLNMSSYFGVDLKDVLEIQPDGSAPLTHTYNGTSPANLTASAPGFSASSAMITLVENFSSVTFRYNLDLTNVNWAVVTNVRVVIHGNTFSSGSYVAIKDYPRTEYDSQTSVIGEYINTNSKTLTQVAVGIFMQTDVSPRPDLGTVVMQNIQYTETNTTIGINSTGILKRIAPTILEPIGEGGVGFTEVSSVFGRTGDITAQVGDYDDFYAELTGATFTGGSNFNMPIDVPAYKFTGGAVNFGDRAPVRWMRGRNSDTILWEVVRGSFLEYSTGGNYSTSPPISINTTAGVINISGNYRVNGNTVIDSSLNASFANGTFTGIVNINNQLRVDNGSGLPSATYATTLTNATAYFKRSNSGTRIFFGVESFDRGWIQPQHDNGSLYNLLLNPVGGNVGIGITTNPSYKLDVNGTGRFIGAISASNNADSINSGSDSGLLRISGGGSGSNGASIVLGGSTNGTIPNEGRLRYSGTSGSASWGNGYFNVETELRLGTVSIVDSSRNASFVEGTFTGNLNVRQTYVGSGYSHFAQPADVTAFTYESIFTRADYDVASFGRRTNGNKVSGIKFLSALDSASTRGFRIVYANSEATGINEGLHFIQDNNSVATLRLQAGNVHVVDGDLRMGSNNAIDSSRNFFGVNGTFTGNINFGTFGFGESTGSVIDDTPAFLGTNANRATWYANSSHTQTSAGWQFRTHSNGGSFASIFTIDHDGDSTQQGVSFATDHADSSDIRLKSNLVKHDPLDIAKHATLYKYNKRGLDRPQYGIIAQDIMEYDSDLGIPLEDEEFGEIYNLSAYSVASIALAGVKEIDSEVEQLKSRVLELEDKVRMLGGAV